MSTFFLLPPRSCVGQSFAHYLRGLFPGLTWEADNWENLADGIAAAAACHRDVFVVFREELPADEDAETGLAEGFGAEMGDEVVELRLAPSPASWTVARWRIGRRAAA